MSCFVDMKRDIMQEATANVGNSAESLMDIERERDELRSRLETLKDQVHRAKQCRHL